MTLFDFVKAHISIVDTILHYVSLRQAGHYWKGTCPFHAETDASFTVSPDRGIFYCFGCHATGDVIGFIAQKESLSQIEAAWHLIEFYKLEVPSDLLGEKAAHHATSGGEKQRYNALCEAIASFAHKQLFDSKQALEYLSNRAISREMIDRFSVGYIPGGIRSMNALIDYLSRSSILLKDVLEVGIIMQTGVAFYSPFEERIIFPIRDHLGRTCGFGGRIFRAGDERAKYYNSKDLPFFAKGQILFGLDSAKESMRSENSVFLVEGYTDCIALYQAGYKNVVATLGTACTKDHLSLLSRYVSTVFVLYDGDRAGKAAVLRLANLCFDANLDLKIMQLSAKEDPASFLSQGNRLDELKINARDFFSFFIEMQGEDFLSKSLADKLSASDKIIDFIAQISDSLKQDLLIQKACFVLGVPFNSFKEQCLKKRQRLVGSISDNQQEDHQEPIDAGVGESSELKVLEKKIICAIINKTPAVLSELMNEGLFPYFSARAQALLISYKDIAEKRAPGERFSAFYDSLNESDRLWLGAESLLVEQENGGDTVEHYLKIFRRQTWKMRVQDMKRHMVEAKRSGDQEMFYVLSEKFLKLKGEMKNWGLI